MRKPKYVFCNEPDGATVFTRKTDAVDALVATIEDEWEYEAFPTYSSFKKWFGEYLAVYEVGKSVKVDLKEVYASLVAEEEMLLEREELRRAQALAEERDQELDALHTLAEKLGYDVVPKYEAAE